VVHNRVFARQLKEQYPSLDVISVEQDMQMVGTQRPLYFDHLVTENALVCEDALRDQLRCEQWNHSQTKQELKSARARIRVLSDDRDQLLRAEAERGRQEKLVVQLVNIIGGDDEQK
jgi:flagellar motility protein MotE (MotC chaperone)